MEIGSKWKYLSFKDKCAYATAMITFILGWIIVFVGFIVSPLGEVSGSVISIFGSSLIYCASIFGIALYANNQLQLFKANALNYLNDRKLEK